MLVQITKGGTKTKMAIEKSKKVQIIYLSVLVVCTILLGVFLKDIIETQIKVNYLKDNLVQRDMMVDVLNKSFNSLKEDFDKVNNENLMLNTENERLLELQTIDYTPKINIIRKVLRDSSVNYNLYDHDSYNCVDFSTYLIQELFEYKLYSCYTNVYFEEGAHALVAVNTTDGLIHIEPQSKKILYSLEVGDDYCEKVGWDCEWEIRTIKTCFDEVK